MVKIQFCYLYLLYIRQNNVAKTSLWRCHIVVMEMSEDNARTTSLQRSLWRLLIRWCNDIVFATSSDVSIATIWRRQSGVGLWHRSNVATSLSLLGLYVKSFVRPECTFDFWIPVSFTVTSSMKNVFQTKASTIKIRISAPGAY